MRQIGRGRYTLLLHVLSRCMVDARSQRGHSMRMHRQINDFIPTRSTRQDSGIRLQQACPSAQV
jgi:hypothetical protein